MSFSTEACLLEERQLVPTMPHKVWQNALYHVAGDNDRVFSKLKGCHTRFDVWKQHDR